MYQNIRNIVFVAPPGAGKKTLINAIFTENGKEEYQFSFKEDGSYKNFISMVIGNNKLNIIDINTNLDFIAEIDGVCDIIDGALIVVDAALTSIMELEALLSKLLAKELKIIIAVNKIDQPGINLAETTKKIKDLFTILNAKAKFDTVKIIYSSGLKRKSCEKLGTQLENMMILIKSLFDVTSAPKLLDRKDNSLLVSYVLPHLEYGNLVIGKIFSGNIKKNDHLNLLDTNGKNKGSNEVKQLFKLENKNFVEIDQAYAGDIIAIAGINNARYRDTLTSEIDNDTFKIIESTDTAHSTISVKLVPNDSAGAELEGEVNFEALRKRVLKEENLSSSLVVISYPNEIQLKLSGQTHLFNIANTLRKAGFSFGMTRPEVVSKSDGVTMIEPIEEVIVHAPKKYMGEIIDRFKKRGGQLVNCNILLEEKIKLLFTISTRGLMCMELALDISLDSTITLSRTFLKFGFAGKNLVEASKGSLISDSSGHATGYSLKNLEEDSVLYVTATDRVYKGMVIGYSCSKESDIWVSPTKTKMSVISRLYESKENALYHLKNNLILTVENAVNLLKNDEMLDITPIHVRIRKIVLKMLPKYRLAN